MRDFEIAALVFIAWVLLYHSSYSRADHRHEVQSVDDGYKISFKVEDGISWEKIGFRDENYRYKIYEHGPVYSHEFKVRHEYGNEFTFRHRNSQFFEVEDQYGKTVQLELDGYEYVILRWKDNPSKKYRFRVS